MFLPAMPLSREQQQLLRFEADGFAFADGAMELGGSGGRT
jgi:hypothetical protein